MNRHSLHILLLGAIGLWFLMLIAPPLLASGEHSWSSSLYTLFSHICHQSGSRSFYLLGYKLAVCARCTGIYCGFFLGAMLSAVWFSRRISNTMLWWGIAVVPMMTDVVLEIANIHTSTLLARSITGVCFGIIAARILCPLIVDAIAQLHIEKHNIEGVPYESKT